MREEERAQMQRLSHRVAVAQQRGLAREDQEALSRDEHPVVRRVLAQNQALDPEVAAALSYSNDVSLLDGLERNKWLPLNPGFSVAFLREGGHGLMEYFEDQTAGLDPEALMALAPEWVGNLDELVVACRALGPEAGAGRDERAGVGTVRDDDERGRR